MFDSLQQGAQLGQNDQAARLRKLARLKAAVDAAQDPADIFEATTDLIEAMVGAGAAFCSSPETAAGTSTDSSLALSGAGQHGHGHAQSAQLAHTLCAALSEPALRHGEPSGASLATLTCATGTGASPSTGHVSPDSRACQRMSPATSSFAHGPAQLQPSYSFPHSEEAGLEYAASDGFTAAGSGFELTRSHSGVHAGNSRHSVQQHPERSARSFANLQEAMRMQHCRQQLLDQQQQQQPVQDRQSLYQLLRQTMQEEALARQQRQMRHQQQLQLSALQQQHSFQMGPLHQEEQGHTGELPALDAERKAQLLDRLKRAITARNRLNQG